MSLELIHLTESKIAAEFLAKAGVSISNNSSLNAVSLIIDETGESLCIWAETFSNEGLNIPGLYVEENIEEQHE